jgi:50S ribosomal protein L16 3-hydroxylase
MVHRDHLLGGLTPASFLRRHWQKRPLCVRGALPGFRDPVGPMALLALAARDDVGSRLVLEKGGHRPWEVVPGPQDPRRLRRLPASHWTLLVDGVDRHVSAAAALAERFSFVPRWRADDVMVSLAAPRGTVGPHVDAYDVFLVQGAGRRLWQVARRFDPACRPGVDLRILRRFVPDEEWVLEPGDLLYVPPGVAHYGVALEASLTCSIGFRAPSERDVVAAALQRAVHRADAERLYADPDLTPSATPGLVSRAALRRLRSMVHGAMARLDEATFTRAMGEMLTAAADGPPLAAGRTVTAPVLRARVRAGATLRRAPGTRAAFATGPGAVFVFVNGATLDLPPGLEGTAALLTGERTLPHRALLAALRRPEAAAAAARLVSDGAYALVDAPPARARP